MDCCEEKVWGIRAKMYGALGHLLIALSQLMAARQQLECLDIDSDDFDRAVGDLRNTTFEVLEEAEKIEKQIMKEEVAGSDE